MKPLLLLLLLLCSASAQPLPVPEYPMGDERRIIHASEVKLEIADDGSSVFYRELTSRKWGTFREIIKVLPPRRRL